MKELILVGRFSKMGGTRTFFKSLLNYQKEQKSQITLFLKKNQYDDEIKKKTENIPMIKVKFLPNHFKNKYINHFIIVIYIYLFTLKNKRNREIIFTDWNLFLDFITLLIPIKSTFFVHTTPTRKLPKVFTNILKCLLKNKKIVTVSQYSKNEIIKKWINNEKTTKVKYLYNYSPIKLVKKEVQEKKTILTLGHVRNYKNPELWLNIAYEITNENKNVEFIWAGAGEELRFYQEKTKRDSNIKFLGHIQNIENLYKKADIYLQLSLIESHGISVVDAMKYSIPCIVSDRGGLPESVTDGENGFVINVKDKEKAINKIKLLLYNNLKRKEMGKKSYEIYEKKFSKKTWEKKMDNILKF